MVQTYLQELEALREERKRKYIEIRELKKQQKIVEEQIISFLEEQGEKGVKYNDKAILLDKNFIRIRKKKDEKLQSIQQVLEKNDIPFSEHMLNEIIESQKGDKKETTKLAIKKI